MPIKDILFPESPEVARSGVGKIVAHVADSIPVEEIEAASIIQKERIGLIVAGVSYPRPSQGNQLDPKKHRTYFKLALNYKNYLLANNIVDRVEVLDFLPGHWRSFRKGGPKDGERLRGHDPIIPKNYRFNDNDILTHQSPGKGARKLYYTGIDQFAEEKTGNEDADVEKSDYDPWTGANENSMSIQDLYKRIRHGFAGTIREVHFIGHAWLGGPIIVNTPHYRTKKYDKDGRVQDFSHHPSLGDVFGPQGLPIFRANLAADAVLCVWGCENNECARNLYLQAEAGVRLKLKANDPCQQTLDDWFGREAERLKLMMASTYAANLAKATQRPVYGALPGTYSVHEGEPNDDATKITFDPVVMHVNLEKCRHILEFYKKNVGATFAKTGAFKGDATFGRGFAIYPPP